MQILRVARRWELGRYVRELDADAGTGARARAHSAYLARAPPAPARRRRRETGGVPAREPARPRARRRLLRLPRRRAPSARVAARAPARALAARPAPAEGRQSSSARGCAPTRPTRGSPTTCRSRPARGVELQWLVRRAFCRGLGEPAGRRAARAAGARVRAQRRGVLAPLEGDVLRWMDSCVEHRGRCLRIESELGVQLAGAARARGAARAGDVPGRAGRADVRARGEPAVRSRPLAERALPAQRAGAADRAPAHPGRRPDRPRRVRRRPGGLRPRLPAHAGGARPARLPAVLEPPAAAAGDARDRGRGARGGGARGARGDVPARVRRGPPAPPARRSAAAVRPAPARASARAWRATTTR